MTSDRPAEPLAALRRLPRCPPGVDWEPLRLGMSGAAVYRRTDGVCFAKCGGAPHDAEIAAEADRLEWLASVELPGPRVVDIESGSEGIVLVTTAVPGVPASDLPPASATQAAVTVAEALRAMHRVPLARCPFDRSLAVTVPAAEAAVAGSRVDVEDLDAERRGLSLQQLLDELLAMLPHAAELEPADMVVCHGDASLPNFLVDPETLSLTGFVDLGRLGRADRYLDLALTTRSIVSELNPQFGPADAGRLWSSYGIDDPDEWRLEYYRLLDEFL